jgi:uncharacterized protein
MNKVRCPICEKNMPGHYKEWPDYPFCSPRCRKIDLGRWLGENYRVPTDEQQRSEDDVDNDER